MVRNATNNPLRVDSSRVRDSNSSHTTESAGSPGTSRSALRADADNNRLDRYERHSAVFGDAEFVQGIDDVVCRLTGDVGLHHVAGRMNRDIAHHDRCVSRPAATRAHRELARCARSGRSPANAAWRSGVGSTWLRRCRLRTSCPLTSSRASRRYPIPCAAEPRSVPEHRQRVDAAAGLRERDDLTDGIHAGEERGDAVPAECDSAVRRRTEGEGVEEEAELLLRLVLGDTHHLEHSFLNVPCGGYEYCRRRSRCRCRRCRTRRRERNPDRCRTCRRTPASAT